MPENKWSARTWHRRASRPVSLWMMVFILVGATHTLVPNYRWVLIHLFTLGLVSNSIMVWSQHLTEKFTQQRLPDSARPTQLGRIYGLNAGIIITLLGQILMEFWSHHWIVTQVGATLITLMMLYKGYTAFALWTGKKQAVLLAQIDAISGILICVFVMVMGPGFMLRLELIVLIPYLIKMNRIKDEWLS